MLTNTARLYLVSALDKVSSKPHPNFIAKMKDKARATDSLMRYATAKAIDSHKPLEQAVVMTLGLLKEDVAAYTGFVKSLMSDVAFQANLDLKRLRSKVDEDGMVASLSTMMSMAVPAEDAVKHLSLKDLEDPAFDRGIGAEAINGTSQRNAGENVNMRADDTIATSEDDVYAAIESTQMWLSLAFNGMTVSQREYWGVDAGVPLMQRKDTLPSGESVYTPVIDFDEYIELQDTMWRARQKVVDTSTVEQQMLAA